MTLHRYLLKEQIVPLCICLLGLTFVLVTGRLLQLTRYLFTSSVTLGDLTQLMALAMPKLLIYTLPMATLMGVLLAFARLSGDNELVALRAAGVSFHQFLPPILGLLLLVTSLSVCNTLYVMPLTSKAFENKLKSLGRASLPLLLKEGVFIDVIPNFVFFFKSVDPAQLTIDGIFVQDQRQPKVRMTIVAEHARIIYQKNSNQLIFKISNGIITRIPDDFKDAQSVSFRAYDLALFPDELFGSATKDSKGRSQMTLKDLLQEINRQDQEVDVRHLLELHQRLALPLSCLLLGLMGAPLGALFRQKGRMTGVTLGLGAFLAYYVILSAGKGLGENGLLPPFLSVWSPNIFVLAAALYLWIKIQRETPFGTAAILNRWQTFWRKLAASYKLGKRHIS